MSKESNSIHILRKIVADGFLFCGLIIIVVGLEKIWKPFQRGFFCGDQSLMYPYHDDTVTVTMLRVVGWGLPLLAIFICEWSLLRYEDNGQCFFGLRLPVWIQGFYCSALAFTMGCCFVEITTSISKNSIGRLRPHFFDICQPSVDCSSPEWRDRYIQSSDYHCTGPRTDKFEDMRKSFLSGHSAFAAYSMIYFALYLQSRMSWHGTRTLRHCLQFLALMLSWFTALSRVSDFKHHWSDVLAGYTVGAIFAVIVWNYGTDLIKSRKKLEAHAHHDIVLATGPQMAPHVV